MGTAGKLSLASLLGALLCLNSPNASGEWMFDADAAVSHHDNLTGGQMPSDIVGDSAFTVSGSLGTLLAEQERGRLSLALNASAAQYQRYRGLSRAALGATLAYRYKLGLGATAPWVLVDGSASHENYRASTRNDTRVEARVLTGVRLCPALEGSLGVSFARAYAPSDLPEVPGLSGRVFDLSGRSAFAQLGYTVTDNLWIGASLEVRRGDVVSTTHPNFQVYIASDAIADDAAFGEGFYAYRVRGTTRSAGLAASWALDPHSSVNLNYLGARTQATAGLYYADNGVTLTYAYHY